MTDMARRSEKAAMYPETRKEKLKRERGGGKKEIGGEGGKREQERRGKRETSMCVGESSGVQVEPFCHSCQ